jgi:hypothetical protein
MKIRFTWLIAPAFAALLSTSMPVVTQAQTAGQDMKNAGTQTKDAAKSAGHGIAHGSRTAARKTKNGTKTAARKTKDGTEKFVHGAARGTAHTADKVENKTAPKPQ